MGQTWRNSMAWTHTSSFSFSQVTLVFSPAKVTPASAGAGGKRQCRSTWNTWGSYYTGLHWQNVFKLHICQYINATLKIIRIKQQQEAVNMTNNWPGTFHLYPLSCICDCIHVTETFWGFFSCDTGITWRTVAVSETPVPFPFHLCVCVPPACSSSVPTAAGNPWGSTWDTC